MAVAALSAFPILPDSEVPMLACSVCGGNPITAPEGSTERTRFVCRWCCARIALRQNAERLRLALACGKNPNETHAATLADSTPD